MHKWLSIIILLLTLSPSGRAEEINVSAELQSLINDIENTRVELDIPAVALVIVDKDTVLWSGTFGVADRESGRPVDDETMFRIGSITKMFTGLAMLKLEEEGLLGLDDRVMDLMPDFPIRNEWESTHPLKVAHFLEHTSGVTDLDTEEFNYPRQLALQEAIRMNAKSRQTTRPPGMHRSYSNAGPGMAAYLLEHVSGTTYEDYVTEKILRPLGMRTAGFFPDSDTLALLATGYDSDGYKVIPYWHMFYRAFGALNVTPAEMAPFLQMLLNKGLHQGKRLFDEASIERMETPRTTLAARTGLRYGYGLGNYTYLRKGRLFHGHGGDADGYLSRLGYNRETMMGYFLVINVFRPGDLSSLRHLLEDYIIRDTRTSEPTPYPLPPEILSRYTGSYESVTSRFSRSRNPVIRIILENTDLTVLKGRKVLSLIPVNEQHFRYPGEPVATSAFIAHEGELYFQDDEGNYRRTSTP